MFLIRVNSFYGLFVYLEIKNIEFYSNHNLISKDNVDLFDTESVTQGPPLPTVSDTPTEPP